MKRKVNSVGNGTLTVSLPNTWVKGTSLSKGSEVNVSEDSTGNLIISAAETVSLPAKDISGKGKEALLNRLIGSNYKAGYDNLIVTYNSTSEFKSLSKALEDSCIGFEIVEQNNNKVVIKSITKVSEDEFNSVMKRLFLTLLDISSDLQEVITKKEYEKLETLILRDKYVNRFSDYCRRVVNKKGYYFSRPGPLYFILEQLEKIGDIYQEMGKKLQETNVKLSKDVTNSLNSVNNYLRDFYNLYYKYSDADMQEFLKTRKVLTKKLTSLENSVSKNELRFVFLLQSLTLSIFDMNGALLTLET